MSFDAKQGLQRNRQLKVQTLSIPFTIAGSATAASVSLRNDEPGFVFLQTGGVNQISAALSENETATYSVSPNDANGVFLVLVKLGESVSKVCGAVAYRRDAAEVIPGYLGSASGITTGSGGGKSIMLAFDSAVALNAANTLDACLHVEYVAQE